MIQFVVPITNDRLLITPVTISCSPVDQNLWPSPPCKTLSARIATGSSKTMINKNIDPRECGLRHFHLSPEGGRTIPKDDYNRAGITYLGAITFKDGACIDYQTIISGTMPEDDEDCEFVIGMDILSRGDFFYDPRLQKFYFTQAIPWLDGPQPSMLDIR